METVRTPDDRFHDLPDYPFEPNYAEVPTARAVGSGCTTSTRAPTMRRRCSCSTANRRGASSTDTWCPCSSTPAIG